MISDDRAEAAVHFIRDNAVRHGQLKGARQFHEYEIKRRKGIAFLASTGTQGERSASAETDEDVREAIGKFIESVREETELADKIKAAELTISIWQTQSANSRGRV